MGVNIVKLGDVAIISAGQSAPKNNYFCEEGTPFIRAGSLEFLERGESIDLCEKISEENAKICKLKLYPANSILFAKSGMSANKGRIYKLKQDAYVVSHLAIITPDETKLIPEYLMYWLQKHPPKTLIKDESYPSIGLTDIANMKIELPPLDEQKKIAKILDKADEIRAKKKLANDKLDEFLKSTFISMFGDPVKNEKGWNTRKLGDIYKISSGGTPSRKHPEYYDNGTIPWIKTGDLKKSYINEASEYITDLGLSNSSAKIYPKNTILFAMYGVTIGASSILDIEAATNQACAAFVPMPNVHQLFLYYLLKIKKEYIISLAVGGAQPNISGEILKKIIIPIPPIDEQKKFAQIVEKVEAQKQKNEQVIEQMNNLFNSLSQRAFKGEL